MTAWRVSSFYEKEPDTVAWLSTIPPGSIFLDVGANVGMYSLAVALGRRCKVFAFEPESQNYALLNANIAENNASDRVTAYCAALTDAARLDKLYLSTFDAYGGGSCHSFGEEVGFDLAPRHAPFAQGCIGVSLDDLVADGIVPIPNYIKIDVDGFEHKVIEGGRQTLSNNEVKELIIEINPALAAHRHLLQELRKLGFYYDTDQQRRAARKSGTFENVGEIIFRRLHRDELKVHFDFIPKFNSTSTHTPEPDTQLLQHVLGRISATLINEEPYPYMIVDNVFPEDYYREMLSNFPEDEHMVPIDNTGRAGHMYKDRLVTLFNEEHFDRLNMRTKVFWVEFASWLYSDAFINGVIDKFWPHVACRIANLNNESGQSRVHGDALIVSDKTNYAIGPHTDVTRRLITFLFYLPPDDSLESLGTSIYQPKDPHFQSDGTKHYSFDLFNKALTVPFLPNRALIFVRNNQSFHGVERITLPRPDRHLVIYNIRIADPV